MKQIQINPNQIKNAKGIKNPESLFTEKENLSKFERDWSYRDTPEFELEVNSYVSQIDYFDGQGDLKSDKFVIEHEGEVLLSDDLGGYGIWKNIKVNKYVGTLKFRGVLMPGNIVLHTNEASPEAEYVAIGGENVSFSGVDGHYMDVEGKFVIILDEKPADFRVEKPASRPSPREIVGNFEIVKKKYDGIAGYGLYLPSDYNDSNKEYPLVIGLHGNGEKAANISLENLVTKYPAKGMPNNCIKLIPQANYTWGNKSHSIIKALDQLIEDATKGLRISNGYITGLSDGGMGTWDYIALYPEKISGAIPICGWSTVSEIGNVKGLPIWAFHNEGDKTVGVGGTHNAVSKFEKLGANVQKTIYNKSGHDAWTETYNNPKVWEWLFKQTK